MKKERGLLFMPEWMLILTKVEEANSVIDVSTLCHTTYSHVHKVIGELNTRGFITLNKIGRVNDINLTAKGKACVEAIEYLFDATRGNI